MGIQECCGTTCDKDAVQAELEYLRSFREKVLSLVHAAIENPRPVGSLASGELSQVLNQKEPVTITRFRNVDGYLLPAHAIRALVPSEEGIRHA